MRIISGKLKGRKLDTPKGIDVRPTTDRVKESMFSIIEARKGFENARVLDLFSGSGNLAFEAISRGANSAIMIDSETPVIRHLKGAVEQLGIQSQCMVRQQNVESFLNSCQDSFDLIFADPPYHWPFLSKLVETVIQQGLLAVNGWLILEHDTKFSFTEHPHCVFAKPYGRTIVSIFLDVPVES